MSTTAAYDLQNHELSLPPSIRWRGAAVLLAWLVLVASLGAAGTFVSEPREPPLALLVAVVGPVVAFLTAVRLLRGFGESVLAANLPLMAALQAWRFGGFAFVVLWTQGMLPGYFALPAGLGDMAVALAAPWMTVALLRQPGFAARRGFVAWNVLGILDLVVAVSLGALVPLLLGQAAGAVDTSMMARLPMVLIPAFFVPVFIILHLAALAESRRLRRLRQ